MGVISGFMTLSPQSVSKFIGKPTSTDLVYLRCSSVNNNVSPRHIRREAAGQETCDPSNLLRAARPLQADSLLLGLCAFISC